MDDVVDLSMATTPSSGISQATVRDLQALTQTSGLTITRAPGPISNSVANNASVPSGESLCAPQQISDNGGGPVGAPQDNGKRVFLCSYFINSSLISPFVPFQVSLMVVGQPDAF